MMSASQGTGAGHDTATALYWDIQDIQFHGRLSRTTAWRLVREQGFPAPVVLGPRNLTWPRQEVISFLEARRRQHYERAEDVSARRPSDSANALFETRPLRHRQRRP